MEALALILGELVFAILAPFVFIVVEFLGAAVSAIVAAFTGRSGRKKHSALLRKIAHGTALVLAVLTGLVATAVLILNTFFFDSAVRYVLGAVEERAGISARCESINGSLLSGRMQLDGCSMQRLSHPSSTFDLEVGTLAFDLQILSMLGTATLETASVEALSGWVRTDRSQADTVDRKQRGERPRREFEISRLSVSETRVELRGVNPDGGEFDVPVAISELELEPLRSRYALFDVLFRSNASGTLGGAPFQISSEQITDGRRTAWRAEQVPIAALGSITGGALSWFSTGVVDVFVDDEWTKGDTTEIDMDWRLLFSGLEVAPPATAGGVTRFVTAPLTRYVNSFDGEFPLEFEMQLDENQFEYKSSLAAAGFWAAVGGAANKALTLLGVNLDSDEGTGERLKEGVKSVLDRVRKPKADDEP